MTAIWIAPAIIAQTVPGLFLYGLFTAAEDDGGLVERLSAGFGLGMGLLTVEIFLLGLIGIDFSLLSITAASALSTALLYYLFGRLRGRGALSLFSCRHKGLPASGSGGGCMGWGGGSLVFFFTVAMLCWILLRVGFVFFEAFNRPVFAIDMWSNWAAGAKFFFYEKGFALDPAAPHYFGSGYRSFLGHPLHTTLCQLWAALWVGGFHEALVKAWSAFYFVALLGLFYSGLRRETTRFYALAGVFFLSGAPLILYHGTEGLSDLPLAFHAFASVLFFWRYVRESKRGSLVLSGIFMGLAVFTKNEGLLFAAALAPVLVLSVFLKRRRWGDIAAFIGPLILVAAPWIVFKLAYGLGFGHSGTQGGLVWLGDPKPGFAVASGIHWEVIGVGLREIFIDRANFNLIVPFWLAISFIGAGRGLSRALASDIKYLYLIIFELIVFFTFIYLTLEVSAVVEGSGIHRNLMTFIPLIFFTALLLLSRLAPRGWASGAFPGPSRPEGEKR